MKNILFVSNGLGEDSIALSIIKALLDIDPSLSVYALPLVGSGDMYETVKCSILGTRKAMPSGGVIPGNFGNLAKDFQSGLISLTMSQINIIRNYSSGISVIVTVGDIYPAILAACFSKRPRVMISTARSDYVSCHNVFEKIIMRRAFEKVFVRDALTAEHLRKDGVSNASYVGNAMMDCLDETGLDFDAGKDELLIAVLPGSRKTAFLDMPVIAESVFLTALKFQGKFAAVIPPSLDSSLLASGAVELGWTFSSGTGEKIGSMSKEGVSIDFYNKGMPDLLRRCDIVIGQAGTANEQAAGLGKPVVAFDSFSDDKMGWYRKRQKGLLGDAVSVVKRDPEAIFEEVSSILGNKEKYSRMASIGKERLGAPGGAKKMADFIKSLA